MVRLMLAYRLRDTQFGSVDETPIILQQSPAWDVLPYKQGALLGLRGFRDALAQDAEAQNPYPKAPEWGTGAVNWGLLIGVGIVALLLMSGGGKS